MQKTVRMLALAAVIVMAVLGLSASSASAQAAASSCPPGQPPGRPPGTPPGNPPVDTHRPQYPPGRCQLALSRSAADRGDTFQASGGGFVPGENVTLSIAGSPVKSVVADGNGAFTTDVVVPKAAPLGSTEVRAAGADQVLSAAFEVTGPGSRGAGAASSGNGNLPRTGAELAATAALGVVLIALGAFAVVVARERRPAVA